MLDDRRSQVLQALVEEYISTGQPVSSRAVLVNSGLNVSSATIRNDLAKLESYGFISQPHTSAGRIPTPQGYRYYVDHCSPARLRSATRVRIESFFTDVHHELSRLLKETSGMLSDISHYPAVVIGPGLGTESVSGVHLVHLGDSVLLAVIVAHSGRVSREIVRLSFDPADNDLAHAEVLLERCYADANLEDGAEAVMQLSAGDIPTKVRAIINAVAASLRRSEESTSDIYVGGTSQLAALWEDLAAMSAVLGLIEREAVLRDILESDQAGTAVRIGSELNMDDVDLSVVSTTYEAGEHGSGRIGVLGPMRMDYRRTIKIVGEVGDGLADSLGH
jgi:heat-inducible transcriptional repressor